MLRRYYVAALNALGLRGAAVAARAISRLEKASAQLAQSASDIDEDLDIARARQVALRVKFYQKQDAHDVAQIARRNNRDQATRVAARLAALVS